LILSPGSPRSDADHGITILIVRREGTSAQRRRALLEARAGLDHDTGLVRFVPGTDDVIDFTHSPTDSVRNPGFVLPEVCAILQD
jgi:hypothetical protein